MPIVRFRTPANSQPTVGILSGDRIDPFVPGSGAGAISDLLQRPASALMATLDAARTGAEISLDDVQLLAPIDVQEVWAAGVTYRRSRDARMEESTQRDVYDRVYDADRPEIFFKATPHRVSNPGEAVAIRGDSSWDVPEPELALVINRDGEIAGYTIGNDMSSRSIEGENPLYLPQAKTYDRCAALGPAIMMATEIDDPLRLRIGMVIERDGDTLFQGETTTAEIHRSLDELVRYLFRANRFPDGVVLMTGTGIVPPDDVTLADGDIVHISIEGIGTLSNPVRRLE